MKILVVSQYFWPESFIINELVQCLLSNGHTVEVITGKPNYPEGKLYTGYTSSGYLKDFYLDNVPVHRVPIIPRGKSKKKLFINYCSYILSGLYYFPRLVNKKKFDIIFVYAPSPITSVIPAIYLKWKLNMHLAVWIQDLWPESIKATGYIRNNFFLKMIGRLVKWIYSSSDTLLIQSQAFNEFVQQHAAEEKIIYYPNSHLEEPSYANDITLIPKSLLSELKQNCCFVFAGNLGTAQALDTILQAAEKIIYLSKCKIILLGSGSMSDWLKIQVKNRGLTNILLPGRFHKSLMQPIFYLATGLLVTLKKEEIFSYTIPSKVQSYLAAGRPILAALDGEGARIITEAGAGLVSPAEDASALAKNIEELYYMPASKRKKLGQAGRSYFLEHFEMIKQSQRLIEILKTRIKKKEEI